MRIFQCVNDQDPSFFDKIKACAKDKKAEDLLLQNAQAAKDAGAAPCYIPDYGFNGVSEFSISGENLVLPFVKFFLTSPKLL